MIPSPFTVFASDPDCGARTGLLRTAHGEFPTPMFMPVGTQATVKALTPTQLVETGARVILANTYHLNLRPGSALIRRLGGLHSFMNWDGPILTDSGGFQVFSLASLREVTDAGIRFRSHIDGQSVFLDPARVIEIQDDLGSDIAMVIDECPPHDCSETDAADAVRRTLKWAADCRNQAWERGMLSDGRLIFGIVQGGRFGGLRERCARELVAMDFSGYAVGGVSVGESEAEMFEQVRGSISHLPAQKPRYVMGVGTPVQLLEMISMGADIFDCVIPTREARHGVAFTPDGPINLKNACYRDDERPLVHGMDNETCRHFSRAYLRHLVLSQEILGCTLLSVHNLHFFIDLMAQVRARIADKSFHAWRRDWSERYMRRNGDRRGS